MGNGSKKGRQWQRGHLIEAVVGDGEGDTGGRKELMGEKAREEKGLVAVSPGCSPWPVPLSVIIAPQIFVMGHPRKKVCVFQHLLKAMCD